MTDRYIDDDETQIYGPYAAKKIRTSVVGLLHPFDAALKYLADQLDAATSAMHATTSHARDAASELHLASHGKGTPLARARDVLSRFSKHLDSLPEGTVDRKTFFAHDGTLRGIGNGAHDVVLALTNVGAQLKKKGTKVTEASSWAKEIGAALHDLAPVVAHADDTRTERHVATPELDAARAVWRNTYVATKGAVESVLRMSGKLHWMQWVFHDLTVPAGATVKSPPADTPPPDAASPATPTTPKA